MGEVQPLPVHAQTSGLGPVPNSHQQKGVGQGSQKGKRLGTAAKGTGDPPGLRGQGVAWWGLQGAGLSHLGA